MDLTGIDKMYSSGSEHSLMQKFEVMLGNYGRFNLAPHRAVNFVI